MDKLLLCQKNTSMRDACGGIAGYSYYPLSRGNPEKAGSTASPLVFLPVPMILRSPEVLRRSTSCSIIGSLSEPPNCFQNARERIKGQV